MDKIRVVGIVNWWLSHLIFSAILFLVLAGGFSLWGYYKVSYLKQQVTLIDTPEAPRLICYTSFEEYMAEPKVKVAKNTYAEKSAP